MGSRSVVDVTPSASRLTNSLRDIGYDFTSAVADLVDNSVSAGATRVDVDITFDGLDSYVSIADDGRGMSEAELDEAMRFGSRRTYLRNELGRYGLGLKTASLSQCRRLTVLSRRSPSYRRISGRTLDLEHISSADRWEVTAPPGDSRALDLRSLLADSPGTVVLWENLDRLLPERRPDGGWARRRVEQLADRTSDYLGMVFHRFLEPGAKSRVYISVNGAKVKPWNPFAPGEAARKELPELAFEVSLDDLHGEVRLQRYCLPPKGGFSSVAEFDRLSGPLKWNRQQGLYIYRADRLIQGGGWCGLRAADEHTKFARAALDFDTDLDSLFQINVAKMRVALPTQVRTAVERPLNDLCHVADAAYRHEGQDALRAKKPDEGAGGNRSGSSTSALLAAALLSAAIDTGEEESFVRVLERMRDIDPSAARAIGWGGTISSRS